MRWLFNVYAYLFSGFESLWMRHKHTHHTADAENYLFFNFLLVDGCALFMLFSRPFENDRKK